LDDTHTDPFSVRRNALLVLLLALAAGAWALLVWQSADMDMTMASSTMGMHALPFLAIWVIMMLAMMFREGQYHMISGNVRAALELARQCMQLAEHASDPAFFLEAHHLFGATHFNMGDYVTAEFHANEGIAIYDPVEHHPLTYKYSGHDPGVCCRGFSALAR